MKLDELVAAVKQGNAKAFAKLPDKQASLVVRAVLRELGAQIDAQERLVVPGLGSFVRKEGTAKDGSPATRVLFKRAAPKAEKPAKAPKAG